MGKKGRSRPSRRPTWGQRWGQSGNRLNTPLGLSTIPCLEFKLTACSTSFRQIWGAAIVEKLPLQNPGILSLAGSIAEPKRPPLLLNRFRETIEVFGQRPGSRLTRSLFRGSVRGFLFPPFHREPDLDFMPDEGPAATQGHLHALKRRTCRCSMVAH